MPLDGFLISSDERTVRKDFTFATVSPLSIDTQETDEMIVRSDVIVTTAFDGGVPVLLLGTVATPGLVFGTNDVKPKRAAQYTSHGVVDTPGSPTLIRLVITPAGSTAGAGFVLQTYRKV